MKISDILKTKDTTLSFEIFPPKTSDSPEVFENIKTAATEIAKLKPDFMSVTCGAGGGKSKKTIPMVEYLTKECNITAIAHITCVSVSIEEAHKQMDELQSFGANNILALRGDIPTDSEPCKDFLHANELAAEIKSYGDFCVGGACYPEKHLESASLEEDIQNLKKKVAAGCDFLTTQMFFDNDKFYNYLDKLDKADIHVPVLAGIMPITNAKSIIRSCELSGASIPASLQVILDKYQDNPKDMYGAGIEYAAHQIDDLRKHGVKNIHLYTMNKPITAKTIQDIFND